MIVYDTNGEQPLSAMISMITKVSLFTYYLELKNVLITNQVLSKY